MSWLRPKPKKEGSNVGIEKGFSNLSVKDNKEDVTTNAKINERATGTEYQNKTAHSTERENLGEVESLHKEKKLVQGLQKKTQPQQHFQEQFQQQRQFQQQPRQQPQRQQYYQSVNANANAGRTGHVAGNTGGGNGKAGVLVVKVLNGRGVMPLSKAQSIASSYSSYKNEVQQRPYAIISFDANEVIAAPVGGDMLNPIWGYRASFDVCRRSERQKNNHSDISWEGEAST
ncbi:hypothetical protein AX774_g1866 [Zancudomyces culisetae]|uniref:Uncharacterized protein n=1 Tax=Zancudomyces culisetae TaxID=1213189 RepID=A0A1R1PUK6_ZANCU|nr:hypothetical protein AX774_g1866 [Zancudomyces culisetae]|eukprot:OMH84617.1 hypothetical protein AX774_g1866 [Zancudomyces culisetae]